MPARISRILKSLYITISAAYGTGIFLCLIYILITGRISLLSALFLLLLWFFMVLQTSFLGLRMPVSVGVLFLLFGLGILAVLNSFSPVYPGRIFLVSAFVFFLVSGILLISSYLLEKLSRK